MKEWMGSKYSIVLVTYGNKEILNLERSLGNAVRFQIKRCRPCSHHGYNFYFYFIGWWFHGWWQKKLASLTVSVWMDLYVGEGNDDEFHNIGSKFIWWVGLPHWRQLKMKLCFLYVDAKITKRIMAYILLKWANTMSVEEVQFPFVVICGRE